MSDRAARLLTEALALPEEEQAELVEALLEKLEGPVSDIDRMTDEEFVAELDRRAEDLRQDPSAGIPWEQVQKMR